MPRPRLPRSLLLPLLCLCGLAGVALQSAHSAAAKSPANLDWAQATPREVLQAAVYLTIQDTLPAEILLARAETALATVRNGNTLRRSAVESVLCRAHYRLRNRPAALENCQWATSLARASGDPLALAIALRMSAVVAIDGEDTVAAMTMLREGRNAAEAAGNAAMVAVTLNTLGIASESAGFVDDATRYYGEAFSEASAAREPGVAVLAATNLGMLHVANRQPAAALRRVQDGLPLATAAGNPQIAFVLQAVQAESLVQLGRADEALVLLDRVMPAAMKADARVRGHLYMALAQAQLALRRPKESLVSAKRAVELVHNSAVRRAFAELTLADALVADGQTEAALQRLRSIDAKSTSLAGARADALARTGELLLAQGQSAEAARFLREALAANTHLQADRTREQLAYLGAQLDAHHRETEIARLKAQEQAALAVAAKADVQRNAAIAVALLTALAGFGWWRLRRVERHRVRLAGAVVSHREALHATNERAAELERELDHKRRLEALGRLTAGAAEDLITMLATVQTTLGEARQRPAAGGDAGLRALLEQAAESARAGERLASQLQAFGRRQNLQPERLVLAEFLATQSVLLENAAAPSAGVLLQAPADLPCVLADRAGLSAALVNLVANAKLAIEAQPGAAHIDINAEAVTMAESDPRAPLLPAGRYVALRVKDDGCGMSAQVLERATQPFFTTRPRGEASGLGLNMVQAFVRQAGGELHLDSLPGKGTTATLLLPAVA